ncbi:type II toxin-antitoxin system ParD family antitoxin [Methylobacterium sp. J-048]|uniref:antitoxin PaaA2 family protein n=1 Tax=Methylobacterium sp. J-048 TaxID=2836635 RepID=UPI001FBAB984|nr:type II toxin-antitoxin system ParD family antitoxin [Methylobacterium sp. J-048]MCJ2059410.1 type II toxin-antitoxin system ParD family antitoxin [Methylobacterium sp. J-048]
MRTSKPIAANLRDSQASAEARTKSGRCASGDAVLQVLDRGDGALDAVLRWKVHEALDDPRPAIPADEVFAELRVHHVNRMKAVKGGA